MLFSHAPVHLRRPTRGGTLSRAIAECLRTAATALALALLNGLLYDISPPPWRSLFAAIAALNLATAALLSVSVLLVMRRARAGRR
ncbi:MAG TPA: hypothetical protein VFA75_19420 [Nevskia sp.]|nr:hypothetical protein [Nevskia sp.]